MILLPELPRWSIKQERDEDAAHALSRPISLPLEHPEIRVSFQRERDLGKSPCLDCLCTTNSKILLRTLTRIFIQSWQQLTGINLIYYGIVFFKNSGISNPFLIAMPPTSSCP